MAKLFISHSSKNKAFVRDLALDLESLGHAIWLDEWEIKVGECIVTKVQEGLDSADYVILVLTPESVASGWVEREWKSKYWAEIEAGKVMLLPVLLEKCDIPALIKTKKYANFTGRHAVGFKELADSITPARTQKLEVPVVVPPTLVDTAVPDLIARVQNPQVSLALCISEALQVALRLGNGKLAKFCKEELSGNFSAPADKFTYRQVEVWVPITNERPNPNYLGFGGDMAKVIQYMRDNTEAYRMTKLVLSFPIAELEQRAYYASSNRNTHLATFSIPISRFKDANRNDGPKIEVYAYGDAAKIVYDSVRSELTRHLLDMVPSIGE